jgi:hypothetical protein
MPTGYEGVGVGAPWGVLAVHPPSRTTTISHRAVTAGIVLAVQRRRRAANLRIIVGGAAANTEFLLPMAAVTALNRRVNNSPQFLLVRRHRGKLALCTTVLPGRLR